MVYKGSERRWRSTKRRRKKKVHLIYSELGLESLFAFLGLDQRISQNARARTYWTCWIGLRYLSTNLSPRVSRHIPFWLFFIHCRANAWKLWRTWNRKTKQVYLNKVIEREFVHDNYLCLKNCLYNIVIDFDIFPPTQGVNMILWFSFKMIYLTN